VKTDQTDSQIIVLFDGVCNLCNGTVQFIIRRDPDAKFRFASLQSNAGQEWMRHFGKDPSVLHSVLVIRNGKLYERSDAALLIAANLRGPISAMRVFRIIPRFIRDAAYNFIAGNRYNVFGKQNECMIPTSELRERFL
jgi:predicted DCC family thiol-disulfide oxidoreductase YuxK